MRDFSQRGLAATKRQGKVQKVNNILWGLTIRHFHFCENYENGSYLFLMYRIYAKNFYVFCLYFSILSKIKKCSIVTPKIRTKFHGNRLVRFRDISHTVSKNLVSWKTRLKFQNVVFHTHPLLTFFTYIYHLYFNIQFTTKLKPSPLIIDSPKINIRITRFTLCNTAK